MTCIVWDGVTLVCDSKVTARAAKEEVRMGVIEFYLDRAQSAANAGTTGITSSRTSMSSRCHAVVSTWTSLPSVPMPPVLRLAALLLAGH